MKKNLNLLFSVLILFLLIACKNNKSKKTLSITQSLEKIDASNMDDVARAKALDSVYSRFFMNQNDSINRQFHFEMADRFYDLGEYDLYIKAVNNVKKLSEKSRDSASLGRAYSYIGNFYENTVKLDSAFSNYTKSEKIFIAIKDSTNSGRLSLFKAGILFDVGIFTESEVLAINALKLLTTSKKTRLIHETHIAIGLALNELGEYSKALEYFDFAMKDLDKLADEDYSPEKIAIAGAITLNNIGAVYQNKGLYAKALEYFYTALKIKDIKSKNIDVYAMLLDHVAYCKMKMGEDKGVLDLFRKSLLIRDSLQSKLGVVTSKVAIGEYFINKKDTAKGLFYFKNSLELAKQIKSNYDIIRVLKLISENDTKNKAKYTDLYFRVDDSLQKVDRATQNKFARIAYETEKIEKENVNLLLKYKTVLISVFVISLLFAGTVFYLRLKAKNRELMYKEEQNQVNETIYNLILGQQIEKEKGKNEERNRIATELHDGVINNIFTAKFALVALQSDDTEKKSHLLLELDRTEKEIRKISHDLKDSLLYEDNNMQELIIKLIDNQKDVGRTIFDLTIDKSINWRLIPNDYKINIYRIIQESIQNIHKYAEAKNCSVMIVIEDGVMTLKITDNGIGFNVKKAKKGIGLRNIRDRSNAMNATIDILSEKDSGTEIKVSFPMLKNTDQNGQFIEIVGFDEEDYE